MPDTTDSPGRRRRTPTKGDRRELAILDAAERQLTEDGADAMTVETIASAAGITRGALYFYFGSKNDVLTALVERTLGTLRANVENTDRSESIDTRRALQQAVIDTASSWRRHGSVMQMAVELAPTVPAIDALWRSALRGTGESTRQLMVEAGVDDSDDPTGAAALSDVLLSMTERAFYAASKAGESLDDVAATVAHVWITVSASADT